MLELGTFTGHTLPIWANWSQLLGGATLITGVGAAYLKHQCHVRRCPWPAWHVDPRDGHPKCFKHHPDDRPRA